MVHLHEHTDVTTIAKRYVFTSGDGRHTFMYIYTSQPRLIIKVMVDKRTK